MTIDELRERLLTGMVIPAQPLALDARRQLDERHQVALTRYYRAAGVGGLAVAVHTTQFAIRNAGIDLFETVLTLAAGVGREASNGGTPLVLVSGICGNTEQACREASLASRLTYNAALVSLAALRDATHNRLIAHCRAIAEILPVFGFYLQPAVGGRLLDYRFWRDFLDIDRVVAIKVAPFNRYHTLDVVRAIADSGRRRKWHSTPVTTTTSWSMFWPTSACPATAALLDPVCGRPARPMGGIDQTGGATPRSHQGVPESAWHRGARDPGPGGLPHRRQRSLSMFSMRLRDASPVFTKFSVAKG